MQALNKNKNIKFDPSLMKAAVYGANDGIITTFAVMAGVVGAQLSPNVVIILGFANLFADGLSMGLGDYLGEKSERQLRHNQTSKDNQFKEGNTAYDAEEDSPIWATGLVTFLSFIVAGFAPILPYVLGAMTSLEFDKPLASLVTTGVTLFTIGASRTSFIKGKWWKNGLEMFAVGMLAAAVAFGLGYAVQKIVGN